jgi:hypothetical protein
MKKRSSLLKGIKGFRVRKWFVTFWLSPIRFATLTTALNPMPKMGPSSHWEAHEGGLRDLLIAVRPRRGEEEEEETTAAAGVLFAWKGEGKNHFS